MFLIDTSVWVDFLRGKNTSKVLFLEKLLKDGDAAICEIVYSEICMGAKTEGHYKKYSSYFSQIPFLKLSANWHKRLGESGFRMRRKGLTPFVADLMIALTAIEHNVPLMTEDKDFIQIAKLLNLQLFEPVN